MSRSRTYQVNNSDDLLWQLNEILASMRERLDQLEGQSAVTTTDSNILTNAEPYQSLVFHSQQIVAGATPGRDSSTGLLEFDGSTTETISGVAQLPRGWKEGSVVSPVVHWGKTTSASGTVLWEWRYRFHDLQRDISSWSSWLQGVLENDDGDTAQRHARTDLPDFTLSASTAVMLHWQLRRVGGSDTYAADAELYAFALNFAIDRIASTTEFTK